MAASQTSFKKGQSGNTRGRPPKSRALTAILEAAGNQKVLHDGKSIPAKQLVAQGLWKALLTGVIVLDDGKKTLPITSAEEYMGLVKFLHTQIDGPPPAAMAVDMTTQGQPLGITMIEVVKTQGSPEE